MDSAVLYLRPASTAVVRQVPQLQANTRWIIAGDVFETPILLDQAEQVRDVTDGSTANGESWGHDVG